MSRKSWIEETIFKRECVKFIASSRDLHRCIPVCQVCQTLIRCCCGRLVGEHSWQDSGPPVSLCPGPGQDMEEDWSIELHTRASPTDGYGTIDFQDTRTCRAKYVRMSVDTKPDVLLQLMLKEWQMERPKLLLTVQGGSENFTLPDKVKQAFSKGLITVAVSTGAWILTDGINTGVSKYVGEAVKTFGSHDWRKRNTIGITPWGAIDNNTDLIGRDVLRPYQPLGNPLSKRICLNGFHSHFLLVDDGTLGKHGCQQGLRRRLEKYIRLQKIHPRLNQRVPVVCLVVEGGPGVISTVLDYVSSVPPVPVFVFEGSGGAADLLTFIHKQTDIDSQLDANIKEDFLVKIGNVFGVEKTEASHLYTLLMQCMDHRLSIAIFDSESEDQQKPDAAILTATLKGTNASPADQLSMALAWDRADIAQKHVLMYGQHWQVDSLEQAMLHALVMDHVSFVKLLIDNGMTMNRFLTVDRLEELYNWPQGQTDSFLHHLVEDVKQTSLPRGYRLSIIDMGLVIEYLIGGAYRSTYTRKHFRAAYSRMQDKEGIQDSFGSLSTLRREDSDVPPESRRNITSTPGLSDTPLLVPFNFNDLFVWAVLQQRQQMALFLWRHGEEALARATVACKLYRSMAIEARQSSMDDNIADCFKAYSLEFGQLAVDVLDGVFRQNEQMAMKLLTTEMEAWSHFTCLQMAVSSGHRPFVSHSCTQTLLTDVWTGPLNMRKSSFLKIILSLLVPPAIMLLEFKSQAEMCHVPQSNEALLFQRDPGKLEETHKETGTMGSKDVEKGFSCCNRCLGPVSEAVSFLTTQCWFSVMRLFEFYRAPVVKFWFHTMSYLAFLMLFSYTILVKMKDQPSVQEWLVIVYILSIALEKTREVLMSEPRKLSQKLKVWFSEYWNISDFIAIFLFLAGLMMRWHTEPYRTAARICYSLDIIFWFIRVMDLLAVNQHAGPYLTMITKMTRNMFFIVVMMTIVLLSFGVSRKAILSPNEQPSWSLAKDVVFQPYWMIFGEVYAGEIDACADNQPCPPGSFLIPFLQAVYMFFQYIIMVNVLIAFFNNIYFDMASKSNMLWKYNRYRYIMTYQERPWLPPPLIILSHMTLAVSAICSRLCGKARQGDRGSGLKLYLGHDDRKRLHEFEERCVQAYFHDKNESLHSSQANRIRVTAERAKEISTLVAEVSEKVSFIKDRMSELDSQLGKLQDLSAQAVDTLTFLTASDSLHQEEARLTQRHSICASLHEYGGHSDLFNMRPVSAKLCISTPPSLLRDLVTSRRASYESHVIPEGSRGRRQEHTEEEEEGAKEEEQSAAVQRSSEMRLEGSHHQALCESCTPSRCRSPPSPRFGDRSLESLHHKFGTYDPHLYPSQEETSMEEEEEGEEEEQEENSAKSEVSDLELSKASSHALLLLDPRDTSEGFVNPAFCQDDNKPSSQSRLSSQQGRKMKSPRRKQETIPLRDCPYGYCRSLSSGVENMAFSGSPLSPLRGPSLNEPMTRNGRALREDTSLQSYRGRESPPSDLTQDSRGQCQNKKIVKIQENSSDTVTTQSHLSDTIWRRHRRLRGGEPTSWSASTSLSQLNFEVKDLLPKWRVSYHDMWSPTHSVLSSWAESVSHRSSLQSGVLTEAKSPSFQSTDNLYPHYSAMERNNLMRLAYTIPFTPVSILRGEEVSVYTLEEVSSDANPDNLSSSWSSQGLSAILQPLSSEAGSLHGGLRRGCKVLCTWAERKVLRPGLVYVVKAFRTEVVRTWQRYFHGSTALQLCLREIQQQRAAQKMMQVFNHVKPVDMHHSPRFLDVSLVLWHSNGQWLTIERNMSGDFIKYNNNTGEEIAPCCSLEDMLLAFSHWTYEYSCRELLVIDVQGVGEELTNPTVVMAEDQSGSQGEMLFGPDNLGDAAINSFLLKHTCNDCCRRLGLTGPLQQIKPNYSCRMRGPPPWPI
ncbi:hypothetical protein LDENG_00042370 [Lucifuga dentata]|nr:hypothetical protein LDENG_00042370 [Lucifuga dentata]